MVDSIFDIMRKLEPDKVHEIAGEICSQCPCTPYKSFDDDSKSFDDNTIDKAVKQSQQYHNTVQYMSDLMFEEKMFFNLGCDNCFRDKIGIPEFFQHWPEFYVINKKVYLEFITDFLSKSSDKKVESIDDKK
jgi:hypothetical protein